MAVPVHLFLTNDGGTMICGSCDVADREESIELRGLQHNLSLPTEVVRGRGIWKRWRLIMRRLLIYTRTVTC